MPADVNHNEIEVATATNLMTSQKSTYLMTSQLFTSTSFTHVQEPIKGHRDRNENLVKEPSTLSDTHPWRLQYQLNLKTSPYSLRHIDNHIYSCHSEGVTKYDNQLRAVCTIHAKEMGSVYDVAECGDGDSLVLATAEGLFYMNKQGDHLHKIDSGNFRSIQVHNGLLFASRYPSGSIRVYQLKPQIHDPSQQDLNYKQVNDRKREILYSKQQEFNLNQNEISQEEQEFDPNKQLFDQNQRWCKQREISVSCDLHEGHHWVTCLVSDYRIYTCCLSGHQINTRSLSGEWLGTTGRRGDCAISFNHPLLCGMSDKKTLLVADKNNGRIKTVDINTEKQNELDLKVRHPRSVLNFDGKLVVASLNPCLLTVYSTNEKE